MNTNIPEISIILPCRNEEQGLPFCLNEIKKVIKDLPAQAGNNLSAEIIVSDSSVDKSPEIALRFAQGKQENFNLVLLKHDKEGYGMAYLEAFKIAKGKYIFMADSDASYSFKEIPRFINELKGGWDMVIGNRFDGTLHDKAMTFSHRYIGNPILSFILRLFFKTKIRDSQCGMRAIKKDLLEKLNLQTTGMEFASEMIVKALKNDLKIKELPIDYFPRKGKSKMHSFKDAWRHIRFMLLYSPLYLFLLPGIIIFIFGIAMYFLNHRYASSLLVITGYQLIIFSGFSKIYSITHLGEQDKILEKLFKYITIERAGVLGIVLVIAGFLVFKNSILALNFMILGIQTVFSAFMLSILGIKEK
jgi:glycosyltransferase involved in cell wall biosynthesis